MPEPTDQREMERAIVDARAVLAGSYSGYVGVRQAEQFARALLRMKAAVDKAPHADNCGVNARIHRRGCPCGDGFPCYGRHSAPQPCNYWKAEL